MSVTRKRFVTTLRSQSRIWIISSSDSSLRRTKLEEMAGKKRSSRLEEGQKGLRVRDQKREDLAKKPEEN
ncbi:hypothetical protein YC2023_061918 [Brassica napus]